MRFNIGGILASMFFRFGRFLGGELGGNWEKNGLNIDPRRNHRNDEHLKSSWRRLGAPWGRVGALLGPILEKIIVVACGKLWS